MVGNFLGNFFEFLKFHFSRFFLATNRPERFKKLREACRKNFHLVVPPKTSVVTSYDQKCPRKIVRPSRSVPSVRPRGLRQIVKDFQRNFLGNFLGFFHRKKHKTSCESRSKSPSVAVVFCFLVITRDHGSFRGRH